MQRRCQPSQISSDRDLVVVQRNPTSGSGRGRREVWKLRQTLVQLGLRVRIYHDRTRFSRYVERPDIQARLRCLVAAGGDGTVSSLVQRYPEHPIAVLPMGTENLVAKHLRVTRDGSRLANIIQRGLVLPFDTGLVGDQRFLLMASMGLDAEVVRTLALARQGNISHFSYLKPMIRAFWSYRYSKISVVDGNGQVIGTGSHVLVANMSEYGMKIPFCPLADPFDGQLDVRIFNGQSAFRTLTHLLKTMLRFRDSSHEVIRATTDRLSLQTDDESVPCQADGDPCGQGSVSLSVVAEKMRLLVPPEFCSQ